MVKIFFSLSFMCLFVSCFFKNEPEFDLRDLKLSEQQQIKNSDGTPLEWPKNWPKEGFALSGSLYGFYGFDISPNYPYVSGKTLAREDSIAYVSTLRGGNQPSILVFTDSGYAINYDYYYCNPDDKKPIPSAPEIQAKEYQKHYFFANGNFKKIALCKSFDGNSEKIQELHTYVYDLEYYNFQTYILGNENVVDVRHRLLKDAFFWSEFNKTYRQAVVEKGNHKNSYRETGGYVFVRAEGSYTDGCVKGDIARLMDEIDSKVNNGGHERRVMIQLGYPVRRFWPLKANEDKIGFCGTPSSSEQDIKADVLINKVNLRLKKLTYIEGCNSKLESDAYVTWSSSEKSWVLVYSDGRREAANTENVDTKCMVFMDEADVGNGHIEEIPHGSAAVTINTHGSEKAAIAILPWLGNMTMRTGVHELGHTMGLTDVNDAFLSGRINNESAEGNIMHTSNERKGYMLRYRGMVPWEEKEQDRNGCTNKAGGKCAELQWECLHKKPGACLVPALDPTLRK
jgi:hypothetical protein